MSATQAVHDADADTVIRRLEEAGATLLSLPQRGYGTGLRCGWPEVVHDIREAYGWMPAGPIRLTPSPQQVDAMDEALGWIALIPSDRYVLRRIVGARALVAPGTGRALYSWVRIAVIVGANDKSVKAWHGQGIDIIVRELRGRKK